MHSVTNEHKVSGSCRRWDRERDWTKSRRLLQVIKIETGIKLDKWVVKKKQ